MDKYTIDIDKVLDDFEEREALQVRQQTGKTGNKDIESWCSPSKNKEVNTLNVNRCQQIQLPYVHCEPTFCAPSILHHGNLYPYPQSRLEPLDEIDLSEADFASNLKTFPVPDIHKNQNVNSLKYEMYYKSFQPTSYKSVDGVIHNPLDKIAGRTEKVDSSANSPTTTLPAEASGHETKDHKLVNEVFTVSVKNNSLLELSEDNACHSNDATNYTLSHCISSTLLDTCYNTEKYSMNKNKISDTSNSVCKTNLQDSTSFSSEKTFFNSLLVNNDEHVSDSDRVMDTNNIEKKVNSETNGIHEFGSLDPDLPENYLTPILCNSQQQTLCKKLDHSENPFKISHQPQNWRDEAREATVHDFVLENSSSVLSGNNSEQSQCNAKFGSKDSLATMNSKDSYAKKNICDGLNVKNDQLDSKVTKPAFCDNMYEGLIPSIEPACREKSNEKINDPCSSLNKTVGFFDTEDNESLNIAEINEYLGDVSDFHSVQDEDSGVSSQEGDINGNNMMRYVSSKDDENKNECHSNFADSENDIDVSEDGYILAENYPHRKGYTIPFEGTPHSIENSEIEQALEKGNIYSGARPKQKEKDSVLPIVSESVNNSNESAILVQSVDVPVSDKDIDLPTSNLKINSEDEYDSVNGYISNCNRIDHDQEFVHDDDLDSLASDKNDEYNAVESGENSNYSPPRLQRPTTLDLPSRAIMKPLGDCAEEDDSMLPSCESAVEESSTTSMISNEQPILDDSTQTGDYSIMQCEAQSQIEQPTQLGIIKPFWIPDDDAPNCMHCQIKFSMLKRRHHCRACGKVLCSRCCSQKARLPYLQNKENRVCQQCSVILLNASKLLTAVSGESPSSSSCGSSPNFSPTSLSSRYSPKSPDKSFWRPNPNNPEDYCSTVSPLQQAQQYLNRPPPTVMVPVGVLKRGNKPRGEPKQVIFSDGIRPGGDLTDLTESVENVPPYHRQGGRRRVDKAITPSTDNSISPCSGVPSLTPSKRLPHPKNRHKRIIVSDSEGPLPPVLLPSDTPSDVKPDMDTLLLYLQDDERRPVVFAATKNMHILAKITKLDCCFGKECWCFTSHGLCTVGQDEVIVILERSENENTFPRDIFKLYRTIYDNASKGLTVGELGHLIFPEGILGSLEHRGFLFVRPTFQCLSNLVVPNTPFLVAILIQKWEVPWAKVFPLRLMLRLGTESRYYPCSLLSIRFRKPVYLEIGQTIMSVLADLRNYQFSLPVIPGLVIHVEEKKTSVNIPRNRYEKVLKVINSNNVEHVLALGSNFSTEADSHLVCMQKDEGDYQTQAINIDNTPRRVTGASFIVFSGALKTSSGLTAKFSIVEDGLLVQIPPETMAALHSALTDMRDLTIACGQINAAEVEEVVILQWIRDDRKFNLGVRSPVDSRSLEGVQSVRIHTSTDYASEHYLIRWTEVFFFELDENGNSKRNDCVNPSRLAEAVAQACCMSLTPYLDQLADADLTKIGLRVTLDSEGDKVEYEVGSKGKPLPSAYMNALDSGLIPVISRVSSSSQDGPVSLELIFHILIK